MGRQACKARYESWFERCVMRLAPGSSSFEKVKMTTIRSDPLQRRSRRAARFLPRDGDWQHAWFGGEKRLDWRARRQVCRCSTSVLLLRHSCIVARCGCDQGYRRVALPWRRRSWSRSKVECTTQLTINRLPLALTAISCRQLVCGHLSLQRGQTRSALEKLNSLRLHLGAK